LRLLHLGEFLGNQIKLKIKKSKIFGYNPTQIQICRKSDSTDFKMQKKWFNHLKIKNSNLLKNAYFAYLSLILSWLNRFFRKFEFDFELVNSLFLHFKIGWIIFSAYLSLILSLIWLPKNSPKCNNRKKNDYIILVFGEVFFPKKIFTTKIFFLYLFVRPFWKYCKRDLSKFCFEL
jgi:hypothetical protein